jgi:hypothetical protein
MASRTSATFIAALLTLLPATALAQGGGGGGSAGGGASGGGSASSGGGAAGTGSAGTTTGATGTATPLPSPQTRNTPFQNQTRQAAPGRPGTLPPAARQAPGSRGTATGANTGTGTQLLPSRQTINTPFQNSSGATSAHRGTTSTNDAGPALGPTLGDTVGTTATGRPIGSTGSGPGSPEQPIDSKSHSKR